MTYSNPQQTAPPLLIVTDLDGTLLDHDSYSFAPARPALERAYAAGIPVIANTSKTRAELIDLRASLGNSDPFIIENGSAICIPEQQIHLRRDDDRIDEGYIELPLGVGIDEIRSQLTRLSREYRFESFGQWSLEQVITHTGLSPDAARQAQERRYSEALLWLDSDARQRQFSRELATQGLHCLQGGRFLSVLGAEADKGRALERLKNLYRPLLGETPLVIALGDSDNDVAMLEAADIAVVIANPHRPAPVVHANEVIYSQAAGPAGWNNVIQVLLDRYQAAEKR
ncbi:mannosyl-3-phosphoglycerate phosphatase [Marinobacterium zhoushanense]|uniref:Mannosyl-3-phosphoglycerate phosphatase n=1 Tax=Marinobacterium zhoushanense TaxID=1679163 RepID=A0ABQ1KIM7_9GAMM|nr:HAD-IIB family hydrolase [Marinobacterium zhoushanense]GGB97032.1 mannosyl-3-phosphoglycerate phosphatase [Marinobacterium zhoushanense]